MPFDLTVRHTVASVGGKLTPLERKTSRSRRTVMLEGTVLSALRGHRTRQRMDRLGAWTGWSRPGTCSRARWARRSTLTSNTYGHVLEARQREVARLMRAVLGR